jgi:hypothetical protein
MEIMQPYAFLTIFKKINLSGRWFCKYKDRHFFEPKLHHKVDPVVTLSLPTA